MGFFRARSLTHLIRKIPFVGCVCVLYFRIVFIFLLFLSFYMFPALFHIPLCTHFRGNPKSEFCVFFSLSDSQRISFGILLFTLCQFRYCRVTYYLQRDAMHCAHIYIVNRIDCKIKESNKFIAVIATAGAFNCYFCAVY